MGAAESFNVCQCDKLWAYFIFLTRLAPTRNRHMVDCRAFQHPHHIKIRYIRKPWLS